MSIPWTSTLGLARVESVGVGVEEESLRVEEEAEVMGTEEEKEVVVVLVG